MVEEGEMVREKVGVVMRLGSWRAIGERGGGV